MNVVQIPDSPYKLRRFATDLSGRAAWLFDFGTVSADELKETCQQAHDWLLAHGWRQNPCAPVYNRNARPKYCHTTGDMQRFTTYTVWYAPEEQGDG